MSKKIQLKKPSHKPAVLRKIGKIKRLRYKNGNQNWSWIAERAGVNPSKLSQILNGLRVYEDSLDTLKKIENVLS